MATLAFTAVNRVFFFWSVGSSKSQCGLDVSNSILCSSSGEKKIKIKKSCVVDISSSQAYEEAKKRLEMAEQDRRKMVPDLRKESRRKYVKKREEDKLEEIEADIIDEEYLFSSTE